VHARLIIPKHLCDLHTEPPLNHARNKKIMELRNRSSPPLVCLKLFRVPIDKKSKRSRPCFEVLLYVDFLSLISVQKMITNGARIAVIRTAKGIFFEILHTVGEREGGQHEISDKKSTYNKTSKHNLDLLLFLSMGKRDNFRQTRKNCHKPNLVFLNTWATYILDDPCLIRFASELVIHTSAYSQTSKPSVMSHT